MKKKTGGGGLLVPVSGTRGEPMAGPEGVKKGRKATPDVQDIISGIVHLLGGKVNLHAASGVPDATPAPPPPPPPPSSNNPSGPSMLLRPQMLSPQSTRINNRAPPRLSEVPFEAIPLEPANSAGSIQQQPQLPFGVPFRPPVWPASSQKPGQNVQQLPYGTGIPLPVQLVPPVAPSNRPWPPKPTPVSSSTKIDDVTTINFFPEDHGVRHPSAVVLVPTTSISTTTTTTSSSLEAILQSSIEDAIVPVLTSSQPVSLTTSVIASPTTQLSVSSVPPSTTTPQLEAGPSSPITTSVFDGINQAFTPPLPAARPGQVFHDVVSPEQGEVDVITSDNIQPQGAYPDSFELVVTAAQNFGSGPALAGGGGQPVTGRPLVIPVSIDQLRQPTAAVASDTDDYVSIDGRKTYFNLYPTDVVGAPDSVQVQPTVMPDRLPAPVLYFPFPFFL